MRLDSRQCPDCTGMIPAGRKYSVGIEHIEVCIGFGSRRTPKDLLYDIHGMLTVLQAHTPC